MISPQAKAINAQQIAPQTTNSFDAQDVPKSLPFYLFPRAPQSKLDKP